MINSAEKDGAVGGAWLDSPRKLFIPSGDCRAVALTSAIKPDAVSPGFNIALSLKPIDEVRIRTSMVVMRLRLS